MIHLTPATTSSIDATEESRGRPSAKGKEVSGRSASPVNVDAATYLQEHSELPDHFRTVSIGAGPGGTAREEAFIDLLRGKGGTDLNKLAKLKGNIQIDSYLLEKQPKEFVARGVAWGPDQGYGTANTTPESAANHKERLTNLYKDKREGITADYRENNPVAVSAFASTFVSPEGTDEKPAMTRAAMTRRDLGEEELAHFNAKANQAKQDFPFYHLHVMADTDVRHVDISDPNNPTLIYNTANSSAPNKLQTNNAILSIGTVTTNPIRDPKVKERTFSEPMDADKLAAHAKKYNLLDENGVLKPGEKLFIGGTSLSGYDAWQAVNKIMPFMVASDDNQEFKLIPGALEKYKDSLVVVSNSVKWVPPRLSNDPNWTQEKPLLTTPRELHAAQLHEDGREIYGDWHKLSEASVAVTLGIDPEQVNPTFTNAKELLQHMNESTAHFESKLEEASKLSGPEKEQALLEASWNLMSARRQATLTTMLGNTIDPKEAPLTIEGRQGYMHERAQPHAVTAPEVASVRNNSQEMGVLALMTNDVIASPHRVHKMALTLMEAGIMTHVSANYNDMKVEDGDDKITLTGRNTITNEPFKGKSEIFVVSPVFSAEASEVGKSLNDQAKPLAEGVNNRVLIGANRSVIGKDGNPTQVQRSDVSLTGTRHPETKSTVGWSAYDINNRDSAYDVAPGQAMRRMSMIFLKSAGLDHASTLTELYKKHSAVSEADFEAEAQSFAEDFTTYKDKAAFVNAFRAALKEDPSLLEKGSFFAHKTDKYVRTHAGRELAAKIGRDYDANPGSYTKPNERAFAQAMSAFNQERGEQGANLPKLEPSSKEAYYNRYIDYPMAVHEKVYDEAFKLAEDTLAARTRRSTNDRSRIVFNPTAQQQAGRPAAPTVTTELSQE